MNPEALTPGQFNNAPPLTFNSNNVSSPQGTPVAGKVATPAPAKVSTATNPVATPPPITPKIVSTTNTLTNGEPVVNPAGVGNNKTATPPPAPTFPNPQNQNTSSSTSSSDNSGNDNTTFTPTNTFGIDTSASEDAQNQINSNQNALLTAQKQFSDTINNVLNGTMPLNSAQQAQVTGLQNSYANLITQQQLQNTQASGEANIRGYQTGAAEYDPTFQAKTISSIVSTGIQKVATLNDQLASAVGALTTSFQKDDYSLIKDAYDSYTSALDARDTQLQKTIDATNAAIKNAQDESDKQAALKLQAAAQAETVRHNQVDEANQKAQTNLEAISKNIEQATFNATFGGFVNADGSAKAVDPTTIPGYTALPNGTSVINSDNLPPAIKNKSNIGGLQVLPAKTIQTAQTISGLATNIGSLQAQYNKLFTTGNEAGYADPSNVAYQNSVKSFNAQIGALAKSDPTLSSLANVSLPTSAPSIFNQNSAQQFKSALTGINQVLSQLIPNYNPPPYGQVFTTPQNAQSYFTSTGQTDEYNNEVQKANSIAQGAFGRPANDGEILQVINGQ